MRALVTKLFNAVGVYADSVECRSCIALVVVVVDKPAMQQCQASETISNTLVRGGQQQQRMLSASMLWFFSVGYKGNQREGFKPCHMLAKFIYLLVLVEC